MKKISEELNNNLIEWSEGNEYLYSLLYIAWQRGIRTSACCGGHIKRKHNDPYILFIVDEKNLPYFESMIAAIEKVPDVSIIIDYRNSSNIPNDSKVVFAVHCMMHNRMEAFYKLSESLLEKKEIDTPKGKQFYESLIGLLHSEKDFIEKEIADGVKVGSTFTTFTSEREKYLKDKRRFLYNLKQFLTDNRSKYDNKQTTIEEEPQIGFKK